MLRRISRLLAVPALALACEFYSWQPLAALNTSEARSVTGGECYMSVSTPCDENTYSCATQSDVCAGLPLGSPCTTNELQSLNVTENSAVPHDGTNSFNPPGRTERELRTHVCTQSCPCYLCVNDFPFDPDNRTCTQQPVAYGCETQDVVHDDFIYGDPCWGDGGLAHIRISPPRTVAAVLRFNLDP